MSDEEGESEAEESGSGEAEPEESSAQPDTQSSKEDSNLLEPTSDRKFVCFLLHNVHLLA